MQQLAAKKVTVLAMDTCRAICARAEDGRAVVDGRHRGYRAVIEARQSLRALLQRQITAAGKVPRRKCS
jgi:NAD(P) transhydrogenase subunit alpha